MKSIFLLISFLFTFQILSHSQDVPCDFDNVNNQKQLQNTQRIIQNVIDNMSSDQRNQDTIKVIPVVVHIIHDGGGENISDAQIENQIRVLNEDYGKMAGTNGDGAGVDTEIRFFLANLNPNGKCTNGIVRVRSPLAYHQSYQRGILSELSGWDNTRYLNMYVVKSMTVGVAGYSSFPDGPANEDGIVMRYIYFGTGGTAGSGLGRTGTHEVGHWLGLFHTFNNGCGTDVCTDGDYVCDTPPTANPNYSCTTLNTCSNDSPDLVDLKENYMDYTPDACQNMLTEGQKMRAHVSLNVFRNDIWSAANLVGTGYDSVFTVPPTCPVVADFVTLTKDICVGNSAYFSDRSLNVVTMWQWSFPGGNPAMSTDQNPTVSYDQIGTYSVSLVASDGGTTDSITIANYITVSEPGFGDPLGFSEDFESGQFPPAGIIINNPDGEIAWELDSAASTSGDYSIRINNLINTNYGTADEIILPYLDMTSIASDPTTYMTFNWAYARSDANFSDEMFVMISTDCGVNYTPIYYRTGSTFTTGPTQTTPFIPDSTQWRTADIDLEDYMAETYVSLKIVNVTDGGNNLYIDDIYVGNGEDFPTSVTSVNENSQFSVFPNPAADLLTVGFELKQTEQIGFRLYSATGIEIKSIESKNFTAGEHRLQIPVSNLATGLYLLAYESNGKVFSKKIIIH